MYSEAESGESLNSLLVAKIGCQVIAETHVYNYGFLVSCAVVYSPNFLFATLCFRETRTSQRPRSKLRMKVNLRHTAETRRMMNDRSSKGLHGGAVIGMLTLKMAHLCSDMTKVIMALCSSIFSLFFCRLCTLPCRRFG